MSTRQRSTRRTVLRTIGSLGLALGTASATAGAADDETSSESTATSASDGARSRPAAGAGCGSTADTDPGHDADRVADVNQYVATVDRIVDGRHVVLLLEDDGDLVDQHVAPRSRLEWVAEGDLLLVVLEDDDLRVALPLPNRPGRNPTDPTPQERFDSLVTDESG